MYENEKPLQTALAAEKRLPAVVDFQVALMHAMEYWTDHFRLVGQHHSLSSGYKSISFPHKMKMKSLPPTKSISFSGRSKWIVWYFLENRL
jgi:hypothetical protein